MLSLVKFPGSLHFSSKPIGTQSLIYITGETVLLPIFFSYGYLFTNKVDLSQQIMNESLQVFLFLLRRIILSI